MDSWSSGLVDFRFGGFLGFRMVGLIFEVFAVKFSAPYVKEYVEFYFHGSFFDPLGLIGGLGLIVLTHQACQARQARKIQYFY